MTLTFKIMFIILLRENYALKETLNKKNLQFVEYLKKDLRRNNDDYAELKRSTSQTNNTQKSFDNVNLNDIRYKIITTRNFIKVTKPDQRNNKMYSTALKRSYNGHNSNDIDDARIKIIDNIRRRVNKAFISKEIINNDDIEPKRRADVLNVTQKDSNNSETSTDKNGPTVRSLWNDMHKLLKNNQFQMRLSSSKTNTNGLSQTQTLTTMVTTTKQKNKKHAKNIKIEKFKKFIQKNKGLLKDFISSKKLAASVNLTTLVRQHTFTRKQSKVLSKVLDGRALNSVLRQSVNDLNKKRILEELPNAAMLDMYPAKGGRIHAKRVKGHLCHRHVLIPEGPKYNSLGHVYLPPHAAAPIAHEYNSTDTPKLLLPRCCNCCHKSVLGCE